MLYFIKLVNVVHKEYRTPYNNSEKMAIPVDNQSYIITSKSYNGAVDLLYPKQKANSNSAFDLSLESF